MTREEAIDQLQKQFSNADIEMAHVYADDIICQLLVTLGYQDVVDAWNGVDKWYA